MSGPPTLVHRDRRRQGARAEPGRPDEVDAGDAAEVFTLPLSEAKASAESASMKISPPWHDAVGRSP